MIRPDRHRGREHERAGELVQKRDHRGSRAADERRLMGGIVLLCAAGAGSAIVPAVERALNLAAVAGSVLAVFVLGVAAVRRELRIRRRLAAIQPLTDIAATDPTEPVLRADRLVAHPGGGLDVGEVDGVLEEEAR